MNKNNKQKSGGGLIDTDINQQFSKSPIKT